MLNLDAYYVSQALPRPRYAGQLDAEFQAALARRYASSDPAECLFAQTVELPDGTVLQGGADFRGSEAALLGGCKVGGKRVLEFAAGSGWLTAYMARQGANVVSLDRPIGAEGIVAPYSSLTPPALQDETRQVAERIRKGWWFVKQRVGFDAKMVYCDQESPPDDLGRFAISILSAALLRLPNPYMALSAAAARTDEAIVVTEPLTPVAQGNEAGLPIAAFAPDLGAENSDHWWHHSPTAISRMLLTLGFGQLDINVHAPPHAGITLFTITGRRVAS
jgi:hypothetical protein